MIVSLPNGKVVNMSIEAYLSLEDEDIQYMISINCGSTASSPWCNSAIKKIGRVVKEDDDPDDDIGISEEELELDEEDYLPFETDSEAPDS